MHLPLGDWQFWVVTLVVLAVLAIAARPYLTGHRKKRSTRVNLTIDGEKRRK